MSSESKNVENPILDPCPFCQAQAHYYFDDTACYHGARGTYYAACDECGARVLGGDTKEDAAKAWNRRDELEAWIRKYKPDSDFLWNILERLRAHQADKVSNPRYRGLKREQKLSEIRIDGCRTCDVCSNRYPIADFGASTTCSRCRKREGM